ncbi:MAG: AraC family transcriptional regulator [Kangiellaceae bacterium]|nr:AraC family transcriptional regulator [Kangiellaceae bacterium]
MALAFNQTTVVEQLFDQLPDIVFFIKNLEGKYQVVNQSLVKRCGLKSKSELINHLPSDVLGKELGRRYEEQDKAVITHNETITRHLELHNYQSQEVGWCLTTKLPILNEKKECVGIIGVSQDLKWPDLTDRSLDAISSALIFAEENLAQSPSITQMADIAKMSPYQLDRRMKLVFGLTTGKWLLKTKITKASQLLIESNQSILDIAFAVGYNDQSAFTRQFRKATGLTPTEFQKRNRN